MSTKSSIKVKVGNRLSAKDLREQKATKIMAQPMKEKVYHRFTVTKSGISKHTDVVNIKDTSAKKTGENDDFEDFSNDTHQFYNRAELEEDVPDATTEEPVQRKKRKRVPGQAMSDWLEYREDFLSEFLCIGAKPLGEDACMACATSLDNGMFRCLDCDGFKILCQQCLLGCHKECGLHMIEKWNTSLQYFEGTTLRALGHRYQLGHPPGETCSHPERSFADMFTVLDVNGIHQVSLDFCNCEHRQRHFVQLLRYGWYPATIGFPRTAITLRLLKFFQLLSFESKTTVYEIHRTLQRLVDNSGLKHVPFANIATSRCLNEVHEDITKQEHRERHIGELAVLCPACPQTGTFRNLPEGFETTPPDKRFLYQSVESIDANFRMKRKDISSEQADPSLSKGWSYFVDEQEYKSFLAEYDTKVEQKPSTCRNHTAVNNDHGAKPGYAASGCGVIDDGRHGLKLPCGMGDLQKGERYVNMDYLFFSRLKDTNLVEFVVSYDIACQWSINLWDRNDKYPEGLKFKMDSKGGNLKTNFRFLVPKFHLAAHIRPCRTRYSFNHNKHCGRTDGEGVERGWAFINPSAGSTKEMGPGSRRDTVDDYLGDFNWTKVVRMAEALLKRKIEAVSEAANHEEIFEAFTKGLASDVDIKEWEEQLAVWEADHSKFNPFDTTYKGITAESVARKFAEQDDADERDGNGFLMHDNVSASQLIVMGLTLEDDQKQLRLKDKGLGAHLTDSQRTNVRLASNALRRRIKAWIEVEHLYIPATSRIRAQAQARVSEEKRNEPEPYDIPLLLPSSLPATVSCDRRLLEMEYQLRTGQCNDALDELRDQLCVRAYVLIDKARFQRGQKANTRSNTTVEQITSKIKQAADKYRTSRKALAALASRLHKVGWDRDLLVLRDEDIRQLKAEDITWEDLKSQDDG
ncbi:hypothetical protein CPC08DRAFT_770046 [Agrocybe pediades]|nr:hypothetical protein CPC08DRAFT_770046 [Agrocybe pediades]